MDILFLIALFVIAALYASVGHGGASGYLALMALFSFPIVAMKPTALLLNLFVAGAAFIQYYKRQHFITLSSLSFRNFYLSVSENGNIRNLFSKLVHTV